MRKTISEPNLFKSVKKDIVKKTLKGMNKGEGTSLDNKTLQSYSEYSNSVSMLVDDILDLFPDINLAIETMTALIESPNDMDEPKLIYKLTNSYLPTDVKNMIINTINNYVESEYNIVSKLDEIITESLYTKGAYIELNIPPKNIIDILNLINKNPTAGVESAFKKTAFLDLGISKDIEDATFGIEISDNHSYLFTSLMNDVKVKSMVSNKIYAKDANITAGIEDMHVLENGTAVMDAVNITNDKPIVKKISPNAVIPVTSKDDVTKHYGYFILLDANGKSVSGSGFSGMSDEAILNGINKNIKGNKSNIPNVKNMEDIKNNIFISNLKKYIDSSVYKDLVSTDIEVDDDTMRTIASYILKKSKLKVIFVPKELVSYYAVNFRSNGTGEALLERIASLASMRGIVLYTNLLSYIKSSVTNTNVKVDLDPDDPNFIKSAEQIMGWVIKNRQIDIPVGMIRAEDFVDWARKLGISFNFKHPSMPDVNIDIDETNTEIKPIESDINEDINKQIVTALMLPPEILDDNFSPEFATTIIANNKLLAKRVKKIQRKYATLITEDIKKKLLLDGRFKETIKDMILANKASIKKRLKKFDPSINKEAIDKIDDDVLVEYVVSSIFKNLNVTLPKPEVTDDSNVKDLFSNYADTIDDVMDKIFSSDLLSNDLIGDLGDSLDNAKNAVKVILLKRFIDENNIAPDITKMLSLDENGMPNEDLLSEFNTYTETISKALLPFLKANKKLQDKNDDKLDKIENEDEESDDDTEENNDVTEETSDSETSVEEPTDDESFEEEPTE